MNGGCVGRTTLLLLIGGSLLAASQCAMADVENFARRIGEASLQRQVQQGFENGSTRVWSVLSYTSEALSSEFFGNARQAQRDIGQMVVGADRHWGHWVAGVGLSYAESSSTEDYRFTAPDYNYQSVFEADTHEPSIAGYLSYEFNEFIGFNAIVGYQHAVSDYSFHSSDSSGLNADGNNQFSLPSVQVSTPFSDIGVNATYTWGPWSFKGRVGHRFQYFIPDLSTDDSYLNYIYGFGEIAYAHGNWQPFFRTRVEHYIGCSSSFFPVVV